MLILKSIRLLVLTGLVLFLFLGNALYATVLISPEKGVGGTLAIIHGSSLPPSERVDIRWVYTGASIQLAESVPTDGNGNLAVTIVAPKDTPINQLAAITVFKQDGSFIDSTSFTIIDKEPDECADAYFIGVHGTAEGPDGPNQILSPVIGETWENFHNLAATLGKNVRGYAVDYPAPIWQVLLTAPFPFSRVVNEGESELEHHVFKINETCLTPQIVLAGYSLGAWVITQWLDKISAPPAPIYTLLNAIKAVELYGDPLWQRSGNDYLGQSYVYNGIARMLLLELPNHYTNNPQGPSVEIADRWQSRCLKGDPICGEGYRSNSSNDGLLGRQAGEVKECSPTSNCEHLKYTKGGGGHDLTTRGAHFLALKVFPPSPASASPEVKHVETFREGQLVFFRLYYTDPNNEVNGFGFVGINGSGWGETELPFSSPAYGRLSPGRIEYPFNHGCGTSSEYESDIEAWVVVLNPDGSVRDGSPGVEIPMACTAPCEVVTPYSNFTWDDVSGSPEACRRGSERTVLAAPSDLSVFMSSGGAGIQVSWTDNSDNEEGFDIGYSPDPENISVKHERVAANQTLLGSDWGLNHDNGLLVPGQTMCFQVSAYNATGNSEPTPWTCITVP